MISLISVSINSSDTISPLQTKKEEGNLYSIPVASDSSSGSGILVLKCANFYYGVLIFLLRSSMVSWSSGCQDTFGYDNIQTYTSLYMFFFSEESCFRGM